MSFESYTYQIPENNYSTSVLYIYIYILYLKHFLKHQATEIT